MSAEPATPTPSMLNAALDYAARGWRVFPCHPGSKIAAAGKGGYKNATADAETIRQWWAERPDANIGLALDASGLVAIDADSYKPECQWETFRRGVTVPETLTQRSAAGGTHLIFAAAEGDAFPGQLAPGVDIKHRGYILLAPSRVDGRAYRFVNEAPIAPCPIGCCARAGRAMARHRARPSPPGTSWRTLWRSSPAS